MDRDTRDSGIRSADLIEMIGDARARTLALVKDLTDDQIIGPRLTIVNPLRWEIGHVAWFQEKWVLRHLKKNSPILKGCDELYNSADVAHDTRWDLVLPSRKKTLDYMQEVLERVIDGIAGRDPSDEETYFLLLAVFHEDMHDEAITYTRQTLGYPRPQPNGPAPEKSEPAGKADWLGGDVEIPGGEFVLGAVPDRSFVFDNEKWAHAVFIPPFRISRTALTNGEFLAFVEDQGYLRREWWSDEGWSWRVAAGATHPVYWIREPGPRWLRREFDTFLPLELDLPVIHVNWYEAEAHCNWAGRRLPTEPEWELAASGELERDAREWKRKFPWGDDKPNSRTANLDGGALGCVRVGDLPAGDSVFGCRQMIGNVWEWTASDFEPYPGFVIDPYREYSQPWFGTHKVLRGGCWTTRSRLIRNTWRNFYTPDRRDVWAGFRTCEKEKV
jgi:iron(II)-dependent oxidoreductase